MQVLMPTSAHPRVWAHIRGRYWSAKVGDISLWPLRSAYVCVASSCECCENRKTDMSGKKYHVLVTWTSPKGLPFLSLTCQVLSQRVFKLMFSWSRVRRSIKEIASRLRSMQASLQSRAPCPFHKLNEQSAQQCFDVLHETFCNLHNNVL